MNNILKRAVIAVALVAFCAAILTATKAYGVWVISGIACILFAFGLLRREKPPGNGSGEDTDTGGSRSSSDKDDE